MNKRQLLGTWCSRLGLLPVLRKLERSRESLKILAYHRVVDVDYASYPFDLELVDATPEQFARQLAYLEKNYRLMTLSQALEAVNRSERVDDIVVLTFDDGFDDLYHTIFPILKKHQAPATIFLAAGLIGTQSTLWSEEIVYAIKTSVGKTLSLPTLLNESTEIKQSNTDSVIKSLLKALKLLTNEQRLNVMQTMFEQLQVEDPISSPLSHMMDWDMVREMNDWGIEFGAHSMSHSVLASLTETELLSEIYDSKRLIEQELGQECISMAYPVGGVEAYNERVIEVCKEAGYAHVCSYLSGVNYLDNMQRYELRRIHVDRTVDFDWFRAEVAFPALCAADFLRE